MDEVGERLMERGGRWMDLGTGLRGREEGAGGSMRKGNGEGDGLETGWQVESSQTVVSQAAGGRLDSSRSTQRAASTTTRGKSSMNVPLLKCQFRTMAKGTSFEEMLRTRSFPAICRGVQHASRIPFTKCSCTDGCTACQSRTSSTSCRTQAGFRS